MSQPRQCANCGRQFFPNHSKQRCCSRQCGATLAWANSNRLRVSYQRSAAHKEEIKIRLTDRWQRQRQREFPLLDDVSWLTKRSQTDHKSLAQIAVEIGCSSSAVKRAFARLHIPTAKGRRGEFHHRWKGGKKKRNGEYVYRHWSKPEKLAERARRLELSGNSCEWCDCVKPPQELDVHHLVPLAFSKNNSQENLALLCRPCHAKADKLFTKLAKGYFVSNGCPGLADAVTTLRSTIRNTGM